MPTWALAWLLSNMSFQIPLGISVAEPAHVIQESLAAYKRAYPPDVAGFPTLAELWAAHPKPSITHDLTWDVWPAKP
jgi:hypothetical protein